MKLRSTGLVAAGLASVSALALATYGGTAWSAPGPNARIDNFMLVDQHGVGQELYYFARSKAIVLASVKVGDRASERTIAALKKLQEKYADQGVEFMLIASDPKDTRASIAKAFADTGLPVYDDELQMVGRSMGVATTGEVFIVNPRSWQVAYHGPADTSLAKGWKLGARGSAEAALDAMLAGQPVKVARDTVNGASIAFPDRARASEFAKISYSRDVAPILADNCVVCHTEGGMGPFAMSSYEIVKGFAPMIRESLRTKRMPPFHADTHYGVWSNDMNLSNEQVLTIVNWIEAGAPRGDGPDVLAEKNYVPPKWPLGEPDVVVRIPSFDVPASGIIDYQDRSVATGFTEGRWLKATAWANASAAVHHALAGWIPQVREDGRGFSWNTSLGGYGPGGEANLTPPDTGIYVPPGGSFAWQMHYTTTGKALTDETEVGYYFYKEDPKYILRQISVTDFSLEIPAGAARHHETAYLEFPYDALIFGTQPHCHSRCYATKLTIEYPDGRQEVLLNQPRYDFGWQREYHFKPMLEVPAGSKLIADYIFDNSENNPSNPDPKINVTFGEQTSEEMLFTFMRFRWKDETVDNRKDDWMRELQMNVTFGAFDDNRDGKLTAEEFRNDPRFAPLKGFISMVDADGDGGLSKAEFANAMQLMTRMRQTGAMPSAPQPDAAVREMTGQN